MPPLSPALCAFARRYPVLSSLAIPWGDQDAFGHVNNVFYFRYFETVRMAHFMALTSEIRSARAARAAAGKAPAADPVDIDCFIGGTGRGPILASTACRYKVPLTYPDTIVVGSTISSVDGRDDRFAMHHAVYSHRLARVATEGEGLVVLVDYAAGGRPTPMPEELRDAIAAVEARASARQTDEDVKAALRDCVAPVV